MEQRAQPSGFFFRNRYRFLGLAAVCGVLFFARNALTETMLTFVPPHHLHAPTGTLSESFAARVDTDRAAKSPGTTTDLIRFALSETASQFHFGLSHKTKLAYDGTEREGNCVEYADLFARILNRAGGVERAYVVRSDARVLSQKLARPEFKDHDWVLIVTPNGRFYVDPTLYDLGLGWDISTEIRGPIREP